MPVKTKQGFINEKIYKRSVLSDYIVRVNNKGLLQYTHTSTYMLNHIIIWKEYLNNRYRILTKSVY